MSGVEILNIYEAEVGTYINWHSPKLGWAIVSLAVGFIALGLLIWFLDGEPIVGVAAGFIFVIPLILISQLGEPIYETHYDVIIDDNVSINDFNEKYEIIEIKGKIYEVKERNDYLE